MKNLTFLFLLVFTGKLVAQTLPFPENNAIWREEHITIAGPVPVYFALCGDTTINDIAYSQVRQLVVDENFNVTDSYYRGGIRTDNAVVRFQPDYDAPEHTLYDFSLTAGESIVLYPIYTNQPVTRTVDSVTVGNFDGQLRKVIHFAEESDNFPHEYWIEGVGSSYGLLGRAFPHEQAADIGFALSCFRHGDTYINLTFIECFQPVLTGCDTANGSDEIQDDQPLALTVSPNPAGSEIKFYLNRSGDFLADSCIKIYAANGKLVQTIAQVKSETTVPDANTLKSGFYIAALETKEAGRVLAHCTFVMNK